MFTLDPAIDLIQTGKKNFVNTVFANNSTIADALNSFVKVSTDTAATVSGEVAKMAREALKFDYFKAAEDAMKSFNVKK